MEQANAHFLDAQIVEAVFTIAVYIAVSKLGVVLEVIFSGAKPLLELRH
ncbi:hypothetical protein [Ferrovibrio sp.]|nr:hypothetical protein [Ferrovibrio sp.]